MQNIEITDVGRELLAQVADALLWAGDDRTADALYAALEASERTASNVVQLFPEVAA